jgi:hypothetical protein
MGMGMVMGKMMTIMLGRHISAFPGSIAGHGQALYSGPSVLFCCLLCPFVAGLLAVRQVSSMASERCSGPSPPGLSAYYP